VTDEAFVKANWELWHRCDGSYRDYPKDTILLQRTNGRWNDFPTWAAAGEFTRERLEHIEMAQWCVAVLESHLAELDGDSRRAAYVAILEREKSALADLKQGMKPTP
jgi:hypothetical protein